MNKGVAAIKKDKETILGIIRDIYALNSFVNFCGIEIEDIDYGSVVLGLTIDGQKHTNQSQNAHGGVLAALADTALGVSAATVAKRVVTSSLQMSFIKGIRAGERVTACGRILSNDGKFIVIRCQVFDKKTLMAEGLATMVIVGEYENIPADW